MDFHSEGECNSSGGHKTGKGEGVTKSGSGASRVALVGSGTVTARRRRRVSTTAWGVTTWGWGATAGSRAVNTGRGGAADGGNDTTGGGRWARHRAGVARRRWD